MVAPENSLLGPDDWESDPIEELMVHCLAVPEGPERDSRVEEACRLNPESKPEFLARMEVLRGFGLDELGRESDPALSIPKRLGDFELGEQLGQGGMGIVFSARQLSLKREVAVKVLRPGELFFPGSMERFQREVETLAKLEHPGIARVISVGAEADLPYFAMERIDGSSLGELVRGLRARSPESVQARDVERVLAAPLEGELAGLDWMPLVLHMGVQLAEALHYAHGRGILHRDIKPSNIMLTPQGRVVLLDFGLTTEADQEPVTRSGARIGTLQFMSPQQMDDPRKLDARDDVYALAASLVELLGLRAPFEATNRLELERMIRRGERASLRARNPRVSKELELVLDKAMELDRGLRYPNAAEFGAELERVQNGQPVHARPPSWRRRVWAFGQRHPVPVLAGALGFWLALGTPLALWWQAKGHAEELHGLAQQRQIALVELGVANEELESTGTQLASNIADLGRLNTELTKTLTERDAELARAETLWEILSATFRANDPDLARGHEASASELLESALAATGKLQDARLRGELRSSLADVLGEMGQGERAAQVARLAIIDLRQLVPGEPGFARKIIALGMAHQDVALREAELGHWQACLEAAQEALACVPWPTASLGQATLLMILGRAKSKLGEADPWPIYREAMASLGADAAPLGRAKLSLSYAKYLAEDFQATGNQTHIDEASGILDQALSELGAAEQEAPLSAGLLQGLRGQVLAMAGRPAMALEAREETLRLLQAVLEASDVRLLWARVELARSLGSTANLSSWTRAFELSLTVLDQTRPGEATGLRGNAIATVVNLGPILHRGTDMLALMQELSSGQTRGGPMGLQDPAFYARRAELEIQTGELSAAESSLDEAETRCDDSARGRQVLREVALGRIRVALGRRWWEEASLRAEDFGAQHSGPRAARQMGHGFDLEIARAMGQGRPDKRSEALRSVLVTLGGEPDRALGPRMESRVLCVQLLARSELSQGRPLPRELEDLVEELGQLDATWAGAIESLLEIGAP